MESLVLILQVLLATVFATAAAGKLLDPRGSRRALSEFGVPDRLTRVGALALPAAELGIAAALLFPSTARWGALAALVLLLAFMTGIGHALAQDRAPDCHCFGQLHSAPVGWGTLARNVALALGAAIILWRGPGPGVGEWLAARSSLELVALASALAMAAAMATVLRAAVRRARERQPGGATWMLEHSGVPLGSAAPDFDLPGACHGRATLESLCGRGQPVVLVFTAPDCGYCDVLHGHVSRWQGALAGKLTVALLSVASAPEGRRLCREHDIDDVLLADARILDAYRLPATPAAVLVGTDGKVASATASSQPMIEELMRLAMARTEPKPRPWREPSLVG